LSGKKNILVTGANGQLGMEFRALASTSSNFEFTFVSKENLPIHDLVVVTDFFNQHSIDVCINCAAYTAVDKAETEQDIALQINANAVGNLAAICKQFGSMFIHFSTDYVFNGEGSTPYVETDATDPVNFYGETKLLGEQVAIQNNGDVMIIRTSWVYSSYGKNFVKTMLRLMTERPAIGVVNDQWGCPTYAADLAKAVLQIIQCNMPIAGIYHYCNKGVINWYEFASAIAVLSNSNCEVNAINTASYPTPAKRPSYSALDCTKIEQTFQLNIPMWKDSLLQCLHEIQP
jgi:dTDP-4-dehydrorhamnose reductase